MVVLYGYWLTILTMVVMVSTNDDFDSIYERQQANPWFKDGFSLLKENVKRQNINKKAKGVIIFVGDGMGVSTVTAARILDGQLKGATGEENVLSWEDKNDFPNVGLSKTYNTDMQTADSAGTATAFMTGVKTRTGVISVNEKVPRSDCTASEGEHILSLIMMAEEAGLSTGVVTTARLTHATPSAAYAHSADRNWECDADLPDGSKCKDIAQQLIDFPYGDGLEVALGGGRRNFLPTTAKDPEESKNGERKDGRNLVDEWLKKSKSDTQYKYVWNDTAFKQLNPESNEKVLGLFSSSHMQYAYNRVNDTAGEPSFTEMVEFAIKKLQQNEKGFVLLAEAGRIDHGHHASKAFQALHDTVELNNAVRKAVQVTNMDDTLIIVTADHSHVFTLGGYQERGNPIFDYTNRKGNIAKDGMKFTTLHYANGPGARINKTRSVPTKENLSTPDFAWPSLIPLSSETHGGEDVGIYARGAQAHLIRGVVEQNYIFHVMDYALCLSESKKSVCREEGLIGRRNKSSLIELNRNLFVILLAFASFVVFH